MFRSSWILACGLSFTRYTLLWFFFSLVCASFSRNNVCKKTLNFVAALLCFSMQCKSTTSVNNACLLPYHRFWFGQSWKKFTTHNFFHFLAALWNCIVHQPKTLSQPVRQSVASQPFNQSAFSQSLSHSIIKEVGLSMKHFDNVNWAILSQQISQSVGEPNSKLPASQSVIPLLS